MILLAGVAFTGTTHVARFNFVGSKEPVTYGTLTYGGTHMFDLFDSVGSFPVGSGIHVMVTQALLAKELAMASRTSVTGLLSTSLVIIDTLVLATSATFLALTRMMLYVIVIKTGLALDAKVDMAQEAREGIAPVIVFSHFDEDDLFVLGRSFENDLVVVIHQEYDDLIIGEMTLKCFDLGSTTRPFGDASAKVQFLGLFFLNGTALFEIFVVSVSGIPVGIR